ncbi:hypothetical protein F4558_005607 [Micromonospora profundi]|nr:hypothetical protein [Micromonospora profundi]
MTQPPSGDQTGPRALPAGHPDPAGQPGDPAVPPQPGAPTAPDQQAGSAQPGSTSQPGPLALPAQPSPAALPASAGLPGQPDSASQPASAPPFGNAPSFGSPTGDPATQAPGAVGTGTPGAIPPPPPGYPPYPGAAEPKKKRGLLIAAIALVVIMVLCVGGGVVTFLTLRNAESGEGAKEPAVAVDEFLTAVYKDRDATKAANRVCAASRDDKKIAAKVAEVQKYTAEYQNPRFKWTAPKVDNQTGDRATVSTRVTMTTADEKVADQDLRFTVVQKTGWWVCEVA